MKKEEIEKMSKREILDLMLQLIEVLKSKF